MTSIYNGSWPPSRLRNRSGANQSSNCHRRLSPLNVYRPGSFDGCNEISNGGRLVWSVKAGVALPFDLWTIVQLEGSDISDLGFRRLGAKLTTRSLYFCGPGSNFCNAFERCNVSFEGDASLGPTLLSNIVLCRMLDFRVVCCLACQQEKKGYSRRLGATTRVVSCVWHTPIPCCGP